MSNPEFVLTPPTNNPEITPSQKKPLDLQPIDDSQINLDFSAKTDGIPVASDTVNMNDIYDELDRDDNNPWKDKGVVTDVPDDSTKKIINPWFDDTKKKKEDKIKLK